MGCQQSTAVRDHDFGAPSSKDAGISRATSDWSGSTRSGSNVTRSNTQFSVASQMSPEHEAAAFERLKLLRDLDDTTKVPFLIVELRGLGNHDGYVAICGKDEYGVYDALDAWLTKTWRC